jgi:hypothetical protein
MPEDRTAIALSPDEFSFIRYGPDPRWAHAFTRKRDLRAVWKANREKLMANCHPGHRCFSIKFNLKPDVLLRAWEADAIPPEQPAA